MEANDLLNKEIEKLDTKLKSLNLGEPQPFSSKDSAGDLIMSVRTVKEDLEVLSEEGKANRSTNGRKSFTRSNIFKLKKAAQVSALAMQDRRRLE